MAMGMIKSFQPDADAGAVGEEGGRRQSQGGRTALRGGLRG